MAYDTSKLVDVGTLKQTVSRIKTEYLAAIAQSGHAMFRKVDTIPTPEEAENNVLYLVLNAETSHYDIYALVEGEVVLVDDTTVNLEDYVTLEELEQMLNDVVAGQGAVFEAEKTDLDASDTSVIEAYFTENTDVVPKKGDVFVIDTIVDGTVYEQSAYTHNGSDWVAMTGNVDADKVIMRGIITLAGNYTQVGNWTKSQNGTVEKDVDGMSMGAILRDILSQTVQPTITANPSVSGFALTGAGAVEAGTEVDPAKYAAATLNKGSYKFGPDTGTGVTASKWVVQRITNLATTEIVSHEGTSLPAGSDDNDGNGFIIGDQGGDNVVSSLKYKVTATHGAGVQAEDNLGNPSNPAVAIAAGTKSKETSAYTPFRNYFYGATKNVEQEDGTSVKPEINSDYIRGLTASGKAYAAGTIYIDVPVGCTRVAIACVSGKTGVTQINNETALDANVTDTFTKSTVSVEGANGYTAVEYNVWVYEPAKAYENAAKLRVVLG